MPLIPAPPAAPDQDTLPLRLDREVHDQLRAYAEFLGSTKEYIVTSALKHVFRHDTHFHAPDQAARAHPALRKHPMLAESPFVMDPGTEQMGTGACPFVRSAELCRAPFQRYAIHQVLHLGCRRGMRVAEMIHAGRHDA